jgi:hypothetical protein
MARLDESGSAVSHEGCLHGDNGRRKCKNVGDHRPDGPRQMLGPPTDRNGSAESSSRHGSSRLRHRPRAPSEKTDRAEDAAGEYEELYWVHVTTMRGSRSRDDPPFGEPPVERPPLIGEGQPDRRLPFRADRAACRSRSRSDALAWAETALRVLPRALRPCVTRVERAARSF